MSNHFALGREVRYFCSDESRWGLKTHPGRVITADGVKPIASVQWPRENFWLYGAPRTDERRTFFLQLLALGCDLFWEVYL